MASVRTITALDRLERVAARVGWTLKWQSAPSFSHPRLHNTELDIYEGRRLVTAGGPIWVLHNSKRHRDNGEASARENIAGMVLAMLPRRGDAASQ